jgi:hypothetical protein
VLVLSPAYAECLKKARSGVQQEFRELAAGLHGRHDLPHRVLFAFIGKVDENWPMDSTELCDLFAGGQRMAVRLDGPQSESGAIVFSIFGSLKNASSASLVVPAQA